MRYVVRAAVLLWGAISAALCQSDSLAVQDPSLKETGLDAERLRVIVLTDIGNEPDDAQSLVRFLLYTSITM